MDQFVFIINSRSGRTKNDTLEQQLKTECKQQNILAEIYITRHAYEVHDLVNEHKKATGFIAVGGDGTVNTLAQNLVYTNVPMGIIPRGSGNGLAKHLRLPNSIPSALARFKKQRIQSIDSIQINNEWSFNVAGLGFDGYISTLFGQNGQRGLRNYMKLVQKEYLAYTPIDMEITVRNKTFSKKLFQLAIANASQYGNNAFIAPKASLQDQILDIAMISKVPVALLPAFFLKLFSKNIQSSKYYTGMQTDKLSIKTDRIVHFHTDGDGKGLNNQFEITVVPNCVQVFY